MPTLFISGIDTDVGKTFATGLLARYLHSQGRSVITQKIAQTGCRDFSEDIRLHRQLMGIDETETDRAGLTCPYIFELPASPHLAAKREGARIEPDIILAATQKLENIYDYVIVEGVGGIYVPLNEDVALIDYLAQQQYPLILVSSAKLGSINHTLLTLSYAKMLGIQIAGVVISGFGKGTVSIVERTSPDEIQHFADVNMLGVLPWVPGIDIHNRQVKGLLEAVTEHINLDPLLASDG